MLLYRRFAIVALAKICCHHGIPTPQRGHWVKTMAGKKSVRQSLPPRGFGMPETIRIGWSYSGPFWFYYSEPKNLIEMDIPPRPEFPETYPILLFMCRSWLARSASLRILGTHTSSSQDFSKRMKTGVRRDFVRDLCSLAYCSTFDCWLIHN